MSQLAVQKARDLMAKGKQAEAVALLADATAKSPEDEVLWQELTLAASHNGQLVEAVRHCNEAVKHHPRSDWLWRQLAHVLISSAQLDEAEEALDAAWRLNPKAPFLWRYLADLHKARKDADEEVAALEHLHTQGSANTHDLIRLGNLYFNSKRDFGRAIQVYRHATAVGPSAVAYYNLGLAFSNPEVSQDLDAADAYRQALAVQPDYALAKQQLDGTATKLRPLVQRARDEANGLVPPDHYFQFYINPIELLRLDASIDSDPEATKKIQRATKQLLHEIELNDGLVGWMDDLAIDKSHARSLVDELHDENRLCFHAIIHRNESLRRFLTHGAIDHFLYSETGAQEEIWGALDDDTSGFREFLSKPFARQYDFVLSKAIDQHKLAVIEVMFDGRRWVEPEDEEICLRGALQRVRSIVQEADARKAIPGKPSLRSLESWLDDGAIVKVVNLLPSAYFRDEQVRLVATIREMAVDCWNKHNDSELSGTLLDLCKRFRFKSAELNKQLEQDSAAVKQIITETRQHSFSAHVRRGIPASITSAGAEYDGVRLAPDEVEAIRWGEYVRTVNGIESEHNFSIVLRGQTRSVEIAWGKRGIFRAVGDMFSKRGEITPIDELGIVGQQEMFRRAVNAVLHFIAPALVSKVVERLRVGRPMGIGQCVLSSAGIGFRTGFFRPMDRLVPWSQAAVALQSGQVAVCDQRDRKAMTAMSMMDTDNAVLLPMLVEVMKDEATTVAGSDDAASVKVLPPPIPASGRRPALAWLVLIGIGGIIAVAIWAANSTAPSSSTSRPSRSPAAQPSYSTPSPRLPSTSHDGSTYRVPTSVSGELDRDRRAIDSAEAKMSQLQAELDALERQIDRERLIMDRTSELAVTRFNQRIDRYNGLLEDVRAQERLVNQMIDNYNSKLRRYGR
jgi:tetratricopeptide (TPR) repeat protein